MFSRVSMRVALRGMPMQIGATITKYAPNTPLVSSVVRNLSLPTSYKIHSTSLFKTSQSCSCGCRGFHTRGDDELNKFLEDEINQEKKLLSSGGRLPTKIRDFDVTSEGAEITLKKTFHDEEIKIVLNVNHTIQPESSGEIDNESKDVGLQSTPNFEVDIKVGSKILSFTCEYVTPEENQDPEHATDTFGISEVTLYEGEWDEKMYCVSADILDSVMYDLLMDMLDERGITNDFAEELSNECTSFEHGSYIRFLENINNFVKRT